MHPLGLLLLAGGAYGTAWYLDDNTYVPEGIVKPQIGGFDARYVIGGLGLAASVLTGGLVGLLGAGAATGALLSAQNASKVEETYRMAVVQFQNRQLAGAGPSRQPPVRGMLPPGEHLNTGSSYFPALMAA